MNKIPSDEEFAKAKKRMRELDRNLNQVNETVCRFFLEICPEHSHNLYLLAEAEGKFRVYVFYKKDSDIHICRDNGISRKVEDFAYAELEKHGRGKRGDIKISFEFDSDENVAANYGGDYFLRLR